MKDYKTISDASYEIVERCFRKDVTYSEAERIIKAFGLKKSDLRRLIELGTVTAVKSGESRNSSVYIPLRLLLKVIYNINSSYERVSINTK